MEMTPYTYILKCVPDNTVYYGVRYARGCHPSDFWSTYFTSSKAVKRLLVKYGPDAFQFEIRQTFTSVSAAREWEHTVLRRMRVVSRSDFINATDNISIVPQYGDANSSKRDAVRSKIASGLKRHFSQNPQWNTGKKCGTTSDVQKAAVSSANSERVWTSESRDRLSKAKLLNNPMKGSRHTEASRHLMSISQSGKVRDKVKCPYCDKQGAMNVMTRWHFENCKGKSHGKQQRKNC